MTSENIDKIIIDGSWIGHPREKSVRKALVDMEQLNNEEIESLKRKLEHQKKVSDSWYEYYVELKTELDKMKEIIKNFTKDEINPRTECKCGFKGRESELDMDESFETSCPKCKEEIETKGVHPEVVMVLNRLDKKLKEV